MAGLSPRQARVIPRSNTRRSQCADCLVTTSIFTSAIPKAVLSLTEKASRLKSLLRNLQNPAIAQVSFSLPRMNLNSASTGQPDCVPRLCLGLGYALVEVPSAGVPGSLHKHDTARRRHRQDIAKAVTVAFDETMRHNLFHDRASPTLFFQHFFRGVIGREWFFSF